MVSINFMRLTRNIILTLLIFVLCSSMAFASDDSSSPEQAPLEVDWPKLELMTSAGEVRAAAKTLDDVYNILNTGLMSGSTPKLDNIYSNIASNLEFWVGSTRYSIADLQGMTWQIANSINNQLTSSNSILGNIYNENYTTNRKLEYIFSAIEDTINIKWYDSSIYNSAFSLSISPWSDILTTTSNSEFYFKTTLSSYSLNPVLLRLYVPIYTRNLSSIDFNLISVFNFRNNQYVNVKYTGDYFFVPTAFGTYIYLFDFNPQYSTPYVFHFLSSSTLIYNSDYSPSSVYIPFDTLDYQLIKTAFSSAKSASSLDELKIISSTLSILVSNVSSGSEAAEALADYFVSPQKQAAEDASSQVINSTLNNFTGSGSGAAKSSDSNSMKDVSGSIQSGLNGGGSVSGATGVFNSGSDFWGWFTQQNSNYINNPYPAPIVNPTRGSGDEIVDFLTPNSTELQALLRQGGDQR